jgi:hypothetical protein
MHRSILCATLPALLTTTALAGAPDRFHDPVQLTGADLPSFSGLAPDTIVAFRYDGQWLQIPVQVDERTIIDYGGVYGQGPIGILTSVYADPDAYTGADPDPTFDEDDELVFMAFDTGAQAPCAVEPPAGVIPSTAVEVTITDPLGGPVTWAYLFETDGWLSPDAGRDYVDYDFGLLDGKYIPDYNTLNGPNPEDSVASSPHYRVHFSDRWIRDEMNVFTGGASGAEILDRHKNMFAPGVCHRTENTFSAGEGAFVTNRDGPVRAIRSYMGANSGPLTQREHIFYAQREDVSTFLRVHVLTGVVDLFDYSPDAAGMTYHNDLNLAGVTIDGVPDVLTAGETAWEMVTGGQGTLVMALWMETDIPGLAPTSYYGDDTTPGPRQCTGDGFEYGTSGSWIDQAIPNTDPRLGQHFTHTGRRVIYYEAPGQSVATASALADGARMPLQAHAEPFSGGAAVLSDDFVAVFGRLESGTPEDLHTSDDSYVVIRQRPAFSMLLPLIRLDVQGVACAASVSSLTATLEAATTALPTQPPQVLSLFDYDAGRWEIVDQRTATTNDSVVEVTIDTNPGRFIEPGTDALDVRVEWFDPGNVWPAWGVRIDEASWWTVP